MPLKKSSTQAASSPGPSLAEALAALRQGSAEQRFAAARELRAAPDTVPELAAALAAESEPHVREAIFSALAGINTEASFEAALAFLRSEDSATRSLALDAMLLMPAHAAARLADLLRDPDPDVRLLACELGRAIRPELAAEILAHTIATETTATICAAAIGVLSETAGPELIPALTACAARFPTERFLAFSVKIATQRIAARAGS